MRTRTITILTAMTILLLPTLAAAAGAGAIALTFNVSARAEGMGGAGVAGVWGGDTDVWANPALLAFRPGVRFSTMHSKLAVGLADDIFIDKQELTFGWRGLGVLYAESPLDHVYLDFGTQAATDENGQEIGTFHSYEKSHAWGVGAGLTQVLDSFGGTDLNRWFDVAGGVVWRSFEDFLAPDMVIQDPQGGGSGKASSHDLGWVARATPLDTYAMDSPLADLPLGLRLEGTYGKAKQNATDEVITHVDQNQSDPMPTQYVSGWAVHTEILPGDALTGALPSVLRDVVTSLVRLDLCGADHRAGLRLGRHRLHLRPRHLGPVRREGAGPRTLVPEHLLHPARAPDHRLRRHRRPHQGLGPEPADRPLRRRALRRGHRAPGCGPAHGGPQRLARVGGRDGDPGRPLGWHRRAAANNRRPPG